MDNKVKLSNGYTKMFEKVKHNTIPQNLVNQIQEAILQGRLKTGDKLPAERELSEIFSASRGSLREALRVLEQKGLITVKTGVNGGVFVKAVTTHQVSESLSLLLQYRRVSLKDLAEFREGVEGIVASLAAKRAKDEDIRYLKHLLIKAKIHLGEGVTSWGRFLQADNEVHMALAHIAGNPIYESVLKMVYDNIKQYYNRFPLKEGLLMRKNYHDLCKIVKAVEKREPTKTRLLVQDHISRFNRLMEKKKQ